MPEIVEKSRENIFEDLKKEFINEAGQEVWEEIREIGTDTLKDLAKAKFYSLVGNEADKKLAGAAVAMITDSLKDLAGAATDKAVNYALERLENFVSKIVFREIIKLIV